LHESRQRWARRSAAAVGAAAACWLCSGALAQDSLCAASEPVVFSCHIGARTVSLCRPSSLRQELIYRFGTRDRVELAWPQPGSRVLPGFELSSTPLVGGGVTTVTFRRGQYEYHVYSKVGRRDGAPLFEDGVIVSRRGKQVAKLVCDDGGEGFREGLDWLAAAPRR
jgi:hypothetical protein